MLRNNDLEELQMSEQEMRQALLAEMTPEERLRGLTAEERLAGLSDEEVLRVLRERKEKKLV